MKCFPPCPRPHPLSPLTLALVGTLVAAGGGPAPGLVSTARAQGIEGATGVLDTPEPPFTGAIQPDRVEVRSGAGESYYPVAVLRAGDQVRVVEDFYGWYRIEAPEGLRAFVSAKDVDRRGDGTVGVVNAASTRVTIKGINRGWNESFRTIRTLAPGDRVTIVATAGDEAYEILAPDGSLVFLPPGSVEAQARLPRPVPAPPSSAPTAPSASAAVSGAPGTERGPGSTNASGGDMVPLANALASEVPSAAPVPDEPSEGVPSNPDDAPSASAEALRPPTTLPPLNLGGNAAEEATTATDVAVVSPAAEADSPSKELAATEQAQLARFALTLEEQPLDDMEAAYRELLEGGELRPFEVRLVESRLKAIQRNRQLLAAVEQIQQRRDGLVAVEPTAIEPEPEEPYAAVGVLRTSSVFAGEEGGVALPKMYRVVDLATGRTLAYLRPARGLDPVPLLGRLVGVRGNKEIDPTLGTPLVTAQTVVALDPSEGAPAAEAPAGSP